jgi:hypothetical protein
MECTHRRAVRSPHKASLRLTISLAALVGCGPNGVTLAPVTGVVTLDGKPVADAGVVFAPTTPGPAASGSTNSEGKFSLMSLNREGAVLGEHRVSISKADPFGEEIPEEQLENLDFLRKRGFSRQFKPRYFLPERYSNVETSDLSATVNEEANEFRFDLTTKKSAK